jgi:hypothetical protein
VWARPIGGYSMHTLSTRTLSALAYERGEEYDPALPPITPAAIDELALFEHARLIVCEPGDYERRREAERERRRQRRELSRIPEWFSAQDLIAAPWETAEQRFA